MATTMSYRTLRIEVKPSPETNDHEVRFFGDDDDIIARFWNDSIGLDPDDILRESCQLLPGSSQHNALIARCSCGVIGCSDVEVGVQRAGELVEWITTSGISDQPTRTLVASAEPKDIAPLIYGGTERFRHKLQFIAKQYETEVQRALNDTGWETPERTAARLVRSRLDHAMLAGNGLTFHWASGRARPEKFTVSLQLEPGPYQILVSLPWNGEMPSEIAENCVKLLLGPPVNWRDAEWLPQKQGLGPPLLAGPTWRRGG